MSVGVTEANEAASSAKNRVKFLSCLALPLIAAVLLDIWNTHDYSHYCSGVILGVLFCQMEYWRKEWRRLKGDA